MKLRQLFVPLALAASATAAAPPADDWVAAWFSAPYAPVAVRPGTTPAIFANQTVRQVMRIDLGGERYRLRLTNELGRAPLKVAAVRIALLDDAGAPLPGTTRTVTFAGRPDAWLPTGAPVVSDPVELRVAALRHVAVSVFYADSAMPAAHLASVTVAPGDQGAATTMRGAEEMRAPAIVSGVEVVRGRAAPVIVAFGDSITEGAASTPGADMSWPQQFARRLSRDPARRGWSVVNAGIGGNRLLREGAAQPALARFDRDALSIPGVTHVVLLEGINDIGSWNKPDGQVTADDLIAAYRQLVARAHARGVKVIGATILPYKGAGYYTPEGEAMRQAANRFIRTPGNFDGVIDFERATADPADPSRLNPAFDPGDHLHPNDAGYAAMAAVVAPALFER